MNIRLIYLFAIVIVLQACGNDPVEPIDRNDPSSVNMDRDQKKFDDTSDSTSGADFRILDVEIGSEDVLVTVNYSGGCEDHQFELIWNEEVDSVGLVELIMVHRNNDDTCEASITETLTIGFSDYDDIRQHLQSSKNLRVYNASNNERHLVYQGLPAFKEGQTCELQVKAKDVVCGDGLFANIWLEYAQLEDGTSVYLQPAHLGITGSFTDDLPEGDYLVGVELSGPYVPDPDIVICLAFPGPSIPVTLYCLEKL